jgi:deoxyribose-phosphate aldolase
VIIEASLLNKEQIEKACEICIRAGAAFIKTGTGWSGPTTIGEIRLIKSIVKDTIPIKASGGIRNIDTLVQMYKNGASRFGVNLITGLSILKECEAKGGAVEV